MMVILNKYHHKDQKDLAVAKGYKRLNNKVIDNKWKL